VYLFGSNHGNKFLHNTFMVSLLATTKVISWTLKVSIAISMVYIQQSSQLLI
jgi:hypothetical protein